MDQPKIYPAIVSAIFTGLFLVVGVVVAAIYYPVDPFPMLAAGAVGFCLWMTFVLAIVTLFAFVRWWHEWDTQNFERRQEASAVTPFLEAARTVRNMTPEQLDSIGRFMPPDQGGIVFAEQGEELEAYLWTSEGNVPWDFIESFLKLSNNIDCYSIGNTSEGTPDRVHAQAFTSWLIDHRYAMPPAGPHPARWLEGGRDRVAKKLHIELRKSNLFGANVQVSESAEV